MLSDIKPLLYELTVVRRCRDDIMDGWS